MKLAFIAALLLQMLMIGAAQDTTKASPKKPVVKPPKAIVTPEAAPVSDHGTFTPVFSVTVGTDGIVHDPRIIKSSGNTQADANALEAIKRWRFKPAIKDGVPFAVQVNIEVSVRTM